MQYDLFIKVNLPHAIICRALCSANVVMPRSKFRPTKTLELLRVAGATLESVREGEGGGDEIARGSEGVREGGGGGVRE